MLSILPFLFQVELINIIKVGFFSLTHMHAHTHTRFPLASRQSPLTLNKIPSVSESWVVPPRQFPAKERRISCTVLSRTKILIYQLLWKNELQKHAFYLPTSFGGRSRMLP